MGWQRDHFGRVAGRSLPKRGIDPWEKSQLALDEKRWQDGVMEWGSGEDRGRCEGFHRKVKELYKTNLQIKDTLEPAIFVLCREVVLFSEVKNPVYFFVH